MKRMPPVDAVIVGFGWTGAIMGMELAEAGLKVLALERGEYRDTSPDFSYPGIVDELAYGIRGMLFQPLARETVTIRHGVNETAVPYRQYGSFLFGNNVGGAGVHWNGQHYRPSPEDLEFASHVRQRYGAKFTPPDMQIQDYGVGYAELEPYLEKFEYLCGTSGRAGNLGGRIQEGGNPFEGPRARDYPNPPMADTYGAQLFADAARERGLHPFPQPSSNASRPYTNPLGVRLGPCNFCGFCERFGCYMYSKAAPQTTILPVLMRRPNFQLRTRSHVLKVNLDAGGRRATGVTYVDAQGEQVEQPAELVIVAAFQMHNVRLMLLSGIGKPYDPASGTGVIGRNYAYQMMSSIAAFYDPDTAINPFIGAGAGGTQIVDDFNSDHFDHGPHGFVGGAYLFGGQTGGRPIQQLAVPPGTPAWGAAWKRAAKQSYLHTTFVGTHGSVMAYRDRYLDLDPTYRDAFGQPLLRITFDWHDNEYRMTRFVTDRAQEVVDAMKPRQSSQTVRQPGDHYDIRQYQTTHTTGGVIMGSDPSTSALNRYLQSWDVPNVFVTGASAFPQNLGYNPTGLIGGLTYWAARAIRETYLKHPGPLVQA
ncbi:GMC family oxidoreductase [Fulvimonas soli]|jgi:gluconate 2-dehydrogenase alpha chain|uniref:Gluconate 2-dehydrogenase alpha chain n=1 Tax=Fulvimonas soli TaxID=155197 RepID=A0A316I5Z2_9GAMM|nr:GMC family oxidoreductase [Fulvimonas soli]PWK85887.1 gluconate 2-dehydrogenase alpha chain [Fulvimonas soli]TNY27216.1 GMC family oxidoreductase [Fulvimonas soli]